jgi:hypothetical protein
LITRRVGAVSTFVAWVVEDFVDDAAMGGVATAVRGKVRGAIGFAADHPQRLHER